MDKYRKVQKPKEEVVKEEEEIRVTAAGSVSAYISRAAKVFKELEKTKVVIKATGNALTKAVTTAEVIKRRFKGLHQTTELGSTDIVTEYEPLEEGLDKVTDTRSVTVIEITLSTEALDTAHKGYQAPIDEALVTEYDAEEMAKPRGRGRGRGKGSSKGKGKGKSSSKGKGKGKGKGKAEPEEKGKGKGKKGKGKGKGKEEPEPKGKGKKGKGKGKGKYEEPEPKGKGKKGKGKGKDYYEEPAKSKGKGKKGKDEPKGKGKGKYDDYPPLGKGKSSGKSKAPSWGGYDDYSYGKGKGKSYGKSKWDDYDYGYGKSKGKGKGKKGW